MRAPALFAAFVLLALAAAAGSAAAGGSAAHVLFGFNPEQSAQQQALEQRFDALLLSMEQRLTDARGLPGGRDWFKHFVRAPGRLTGYGVKTLTGVREAIDGSRWDEANEYAVLSAKGLSTYCDQLDKATDLLRQRSRDTHRSAVTSRTAAPGCLGRI